MPKASIRPTDPKNNKKNKLKKSLNKQKNESSSITKLIETGDVSMEMSDFENALTHYSNACTSIRSRIEHEKEGENYIVLLAKILGKIGEARVSVGDDDNAIYDFIEGVTLLGGDDTKSENEKDDGMDVDKKHDTNRQVILSDLYLYLAQMRNGEEALMTYQKGIRELKMISEVSVERMENTVGENGDVLAHTRTKICSAYCSMAELYLTDLCFSPDAEDQCEKLLQLALENDTDGSTPDALQVLGNLRLSQSKAVEAAVTMLKVWERMRIGCTSLSTIVGISLEEVEDSGEEGAATELQNVEEVNAIPNFEFRTQSAKLLFECAFILLSPEEEQNTDISEAIASGIPNKCLEASVLTLGSLLAENDEVIEIWYFLGCAFSSLKQDDMAQFYYEKTLEMLEKVKENLERGGAEDDQTELQDICERIESVQDKLKSVHVSMEEEEESLPVW